jgi:hypothetical protein
MIIGQNSTGQVTKLVDNFLHFTLFDDQCTRQTILYYSLFDVLIYWKKQYKIYYIFFDVQCLILYSISNRTTQLFPFHHSIAQNSISNKGKQDEELRGR